VDLAHEFAFLRDSVRQSIADIRSAVGDVREHAARDADVPEIEQLEADRQVGSVFRDRFNFVVHAVEEVVSAAAQKFEPGTDASEFEQRQTLSNIRSGYPLLNALQEMRPWLTREGPSAGVPLGALAYLTAAAHGVLRKPADVLAVPADKYTYRAVPQPLLDSVRQASEYGLGDAHAGDEQPELPDGPLPLLVNVPLQEAPRLLLHVLAVHELAHGAEQDQQLARNVEDRRPETDEEARERKDAIATMANQSDAEAAMWDKALIETRRRWVVEALCDAIALAWAGPAYLLAFATFLLRWEEFIATPKHPATELRVELLLSHAEALGWKPFLENQLAPVHEWLSDVASRKPPHPTPGQPVFDAAETYLRNRQPAILEVVRGHLGGDALDPVQHDVQLARIMSLLRLQILPVFSEPDLRFDPRAITTAGWYHRLIADEDGGESFPLERLVDVVADSELQGFLAKAIELSRIVDAWSSVRASVVDEPMRY